MDTPDQDASSVTNKQAAETVEELPLEELVIESPKAVTWRRNKLSDKERYEDDFLFSVNGKQMVIDQDVANELDIVGLTVWDSSLVVMKYLEKLRAQGQFGAGMKVLELGSGCAPVAVAAAMLGAEVLATDVEWILVFTKRNAELNREVIQECGGSVECKTLYWGRDTDLEGLPRFDMIIAADCIYKEKQVISLLRTLHKLADETTKILVGYEQHNPESARAFYVHVNQYFNTESIPLSQQDAYYQHPKIKLMWLTKREYTPPPTPSADSSWVAATATKKPEPQTQPPQQPPPHQADDGNQASGP